eukprot:TRINITY_DN12_c0_g1_i1.p1 TRINITY_DN12_c0_g1~~TRINITY_DN12_c0_g1_i1.p1  ORF type:complete len:511 (+),score=194.07 TRINITY_DN12_c0_g1_i1:67-1599(+)
MHQLVAAALTASAAAVPGIKLRQRPTGERVMVDSLGRERAFHGTNAIVKGPPWVPSRDGFDGLTSLTKEDFQYMQQAGLNVIRLGVMWPGVEPARGQYNATYLKMITDIAEEAAQYGIYTLADMHQDVLSERFCGEGIPAWASEPEGLVPFPLPVAMPYKTDPATGFPTRQECAKKKWASYYAPLATGSAFDRLYTNHNNLTESWGAFWAEVSRAFGDAPHLLGLELINEPFIGNPYKDPLRLLPDIGDRQRLQPAYDVLSKHIREVAPDRLVFFAGCTWDRTGDEIVDILPLGFTHPPGGKEFADRAVNAFHYYEPPQDKTKTAAYFQQRIKDARRLQTGSFLTESCCGGMFDRAGPMAESLGMSWIQWEWKDFCKETPETKASVSQNAAYGACKTGFGAGPFPGGVFQESTLRKFARTYAPAIAGNFSTGFFNITTRVFDLTYLVDTTLGDDAPTVLSATKLMYPEGFNLTVVPSGALAVTMTAEGAELRPAPGTAFGAEVSITVNPK